MKDAIIKLVSSRKAIMAVLGFVAYALARRGIIADPAVAVEVTYPFIAYVLGQGLADFGKEANGQPKTRKTRKRAGMDTENTI